MEFSSSITDPFDWPSTMPELRTIDNLLRCGICCEFLNIAMVIPKCSHNYCSECIRRYMNYKSQCPACNTPALEGEIHNNKVLDEVVKNFIQVRPHILKLCKGQGERSNPASEKVTPTRVRKDGRRFPKSFERAASLTPSTALAVEEASKHFTSGTPKRSPPQTPVVDPFNRSSQENGTLSSASGDDEDEVVVIDEVARPPPPGLTSPSTSKDTTQKTPATRSDKSSCPVCGVPVALKHINGHLDSCLKRSTEKKPTTSTEKRKPLPKLVYNIMSDRELRKKLKEYKLSTQGTRKELMRRIQEYTVLFNAQCDSDDPIAVEDVIKYFEKMEKVRNKPLQKSSSRAFKLKLEKGQNEEDILKSQHEYLNHHSKQFNDLVKIAREKMKKLKRMPSMGDAERQAEQCSEPSVDSESGAEVNRSKVNSEHKMITEPDQMASHSSERVTKCVGEPPASGVTHESDFSDSENRKVKVKNMELSSDITNGMANTDIETSKTPEPVSPSLFENSYSFEEAYLEESRHSAEERVPSFSNVDARCRVNSTVCQVANHVEEPTSPVFGNGSCKEMNAAVDNDSNYSSHGSPQEQCSEPNLKRRGRFSNNKLRRKRKTALEQLGLDLANVTEESTRRASKRNKKF